MGFVQVNHRVLQYFPGYAFFRVLNIVSVVVPRPGQSVLDLFCLDIATEMAGQVLGGDGLVAYGNIARY